jgi:hypothetical protein
MMTISLRSVDTSTAISGAVSASSAASSALSISSLRMTSGQSSVWWPLCEMSSRWPQNSASRLIRNATRSRLIQLGRLFEAHGRFTLPLELQKRAIDWIASDGSWSGIVNYLMTRDTPNEAELYYRMQGLYSALASFVANHQIRRPEETNLHTPAAEGEVEAKKSRKAG